MDPCRGEYIWYKGNTNFQRRKKMTSLKDQYKMLKDVGKGVEEDKKKFAPPFEKNAVLLPKVKKLFKNNKEKTK